MNPEQDPIYLKQAIELAKSSVSQGGGPFGAVIVKDGRIIGEGNNRVTLLNDPTAHAEVRAIREACSNIENFDLTGSTLYASCEPCPMCFAAIYWARIGRVVFAASGADAARAGFDDTLIAREICQPYDERSITMEQHASPGSNDSFKLWKEKNDKIEY